MDTGWRKRRATRGKVGAGSREGDDGGKEDENNSERGGRRRGKGDWGKTQLGLV
jgi:hypothetical protein